MANFGRFVCVLVPFALTVASMIAMLVATLAGVTNKSLYMFEVNTTDLQIPASDVAQLISSRSILAAREPEPVNLHDASNLLSTKASSSSSSSTASTLASTLSSTNVTAADLGLGTLYQVGLWSYCETEQNSSVVCTKPAFNFAAAALNTTTSEVTSLITSTGLNVTLPTAIMDAIQAYDTVSRWTEIVFVIALVALAVELFFGLFAGCSRAFSCVTFLVAMVATVAVCAAAALATATAVIVVGSLEASAKWYGVTASFNTRFLATIWIGAAFALASGFFWLFTICCCAPDHHSRRSSPRAVSRNMDVEGEKLVPSSGYAPLHDTGYNGAAAYMGPANHHGYAHGANGAQRNVAYEPYAHSRV